MSTNQEVFNQIAPGWYNFRHRTIFRTELEAMAQRWRRGRLLNIGCGHGPDFLPFKQDFELHGVDFSIEMLKLARKYSIKFEFAVSLVEADACCLPYSAETFEQAIAVATYHHLKDKEDRLKALQELRRVLKPEGEAFITVWNRWQPRFWLKRQETLVPWHSGDNILFRYYYLFSYRELEKLVKKAGFTILKSFPESTYHFPIKTFSRNICLLVKRV
ncbi:MAG: SAM-dependent methyltransferase [Chloroflexi bacterium RBG_16_50_9]|nr:MAG: SAM-dependent methyltransferase [Chloroflexi bacterium RBG_16_50_9]